MAGCKAQEGREDESESQRMNDYDFAYEVSDSISLVHENQTAIVPRIESQQSSSTLEDQPVHPVHTTSSTRRLLFLHQCIWVAVFAYIGVGVRIALNRLEQAWIFRSFLLSRLGQSFFLANVLGCFVMGLAVRIQRQTSMVYPALYTGITTGFCGCCTTFASWNLFAAKQFLQFSSKGDPKTNAPLDGIVILLALYPVFYGAFRLGHCAMSAWVARRFKNDPSDVKLVHLLDYDANIQPLLHQVQKQMAREDDSWTFDTANPPIANEEAMSRRSASGLQQRQSQQQRRRQDLPHLALQLASTYSEWSHHVMEDSYKASIAPSPSLVLPMLVLVSMTLGVWLLLLLLLLVFSEESDATMYRQQQSWAAICFAPWGALLRFVVSLKFNNPSRYNATHFPMGTFLANISASLGDAAVEVMGATMGKEKIQSDKAWAIWGMGALVTGFFGSLSTVSTWIYEMHSLLSTYPSTSGKAIRYWLFSILVAQGFILLILQCYVWSEGVKEGGMKSIQDTHG